MEWWQVLMFVVGATALVLMFSALSDAMGGSETVIGFLLLLLAGGLTILFLGFANRAG